MSEPIPEAPDGLINALKEGRAIAIVGSGLSIAARMPSWKDLLLGIAQYAQKVKPNNETEIQQVKRDIDTGKFLDAASSLHELLGNEFKENIIGRIGQECWPTLSHRILMQLGFRVVITTNYDLLLERATRPNDEILVRTNSHPDISVLLRGGKRFIFKIHGDINHRNDIIITREDYRQLMHSETNSTQEFLKSLFLNNHPFWIGCGHNDPDLDFVSDELLIKFNITSGTALVHAKEGMTLNRLKKAGVFSSEIASYDDIPEYLLGLARKVDRKLIFSVTLEVPWRDLHEANKIGYDFADVLYKLGYDVSYIGAMPGSTKIYLDAGTKTYDKLKALLESKNYVLFRNLRSAGVIEIMGIPIGTEGISDNFNFVNRDYEIKQITTGGLQAPYLLINAPMGYGKTRLLDRISDLLILLRQISVCVFCDNCR